MNLGGASLDDGRSSALARAIGSAAANEIARRWSERRCRFFMTQRCPLPAPGTVSVAGWLHEQPHVVARGRTAAPAPPAAGLPVGDFVLLPQVFELRSRH